jgi:hypothetical protein
MPRRCEDHVATVLTGPAVAFFCSVIIVFIVYATVPRAVPAAMVVPAIAALLYLLAAAAALIGWWTHENRKAGHVTYWDVAGALTFIGIGLSALVDPEQMVRLIETLTAGNEAGAPSDATTAPVSLKAGS